jgi:presenilin-like A22 family membrane protease
MKHNLKITAIILLMFIITQFIGLFVINYYSDISLPFGMGVPEQEMDYSINFFSIIFSFIIAILILFLLMNLKSGWIMRLWFFTVIMLTLSITLIAIIDLPQKYYLFSLVFVFPFALMKVYKRNIIVHNLTELLIYPGIAAVFVPLLNITWAIGLLILISLYDAWAVWKSGIMQKMAKYQMDKLKIFAGFFIPYLTKKQRKQLEKIPKSELKKKGIKANVAILGGGDVAFTLIPAGVVLIHWGIWPAIGVIIGGFAGLAFLLLLSKKKTFYPAMPFITTGILIAMGISWLLM